MLSRRRVLAAKIEATEGVGETISASDGGILAIEPKVDVDIKMTERNVFMFTLSRLTSIPGTRAARVIFKAELKGAGSVYSAMVKPAIGKYLRACGFAETIDTSTGTEKATYTPASMGVPSLTIECYEDGVAKRIIGARGNVKISGRIGEHVLAEFDFLGVWDGIRDASMITPTFEGTTPPILLSAQFSVANYGAIITGFDVDMANTIVLRENINTSTGFISALITGRKPNGKINPEMTSVGTHDWYGKWVSGTTGALNIGDIGTTQYNKVKITSPKVAYTKISDADREGLAVADTNFELAMDTGDDEIEIIFS